MITSDFIREWKCSQHADRQLLLTLTQRFHHKHVKLQHFLIHEFSRGSASAAETLTETILFSWSTADHCEHHGDDRQRDASPVVTLYTNADTECVTLDPTHSSNMTWMRHGPGSNIKAGWASRARCEGGNGLKTHFHRLRDTFACYYTEIAARPNQKGFLKSRFFRLPTWSLSCSSSRRKTQQLLRFHHTHLMLQVKHRGPNRTWWWDLTQNKDNWFMIIFIISRRIKMSASRVSANDTNVQMCAGSLHTLTDGWLSFQEVDGQSVTAGLDRCWARHRCEPVWRMKPSEHPVVLLTISFTTINVGDDKLSNSLVQFVNFQFWVRVRKHHVWAQITPGSVCTDTAGDSLMSHTTSYIIRFCLQIRG